MEATIEWRDMVRLMMSYPKTPVRARVIEDGSDHEFEVIHDGHHLWMIADETGIEVTSDESTVFVHSGEIHCIRGMGVAANNRIKSMVQGRMLSHLSEASGRLIGSETLAGRPCWVAEVVGLDRSSPVILWVDAETGTILRRSSDGLDIRLDDVCFGSVEEPLF